MQGLLTSAAQLTSRAVSARQRAVTLGEMLPAWEAASAAAGAMMLIDRAFDELQRFGKAPELNVITPRRTRLVRAPDLRAFQRAIVACSRQTRSMRARHGRPRPDPWRGGGAAAARLRISSSDLERHRGTPSCARRPCVLPELVTRDRVLHENARAVAGCAGDALRIFARGAAAPCRAGRQRSGRRAAVQPAAGTDRRDPALLRRAAPPSQDSRRLRAADDRRRWSRAPITIAARRGCCADALSRLRVRRVSRQPSGQPASWTSMRCAFARWRSRPLHALSSVTSSSRSRIRLRIAAACGRPTSISWRDCRDSRRSTSSLPKRCSGTGFHQRLHEAAARHRGRTARRRRPQPPILVVPDVDGADRRVRVPRPRRGAGRIRARAQERGPATDAARSDGDRLSAAAAVSVSGAAGVRRCAACRTRRSIRCRWRRSRSRPRST